MCSLDSLVIKNANIQPDVKSAISPLIYIHLNFGQTILFILGLTSHLKEGVKFVMSKKLLFWMETMSLLGKAYDMSLILKRVLSWKVGFQLISLQHI